MRKCENVPNLGQRNCWIGRTVLAKTPNLELHIVWRKNLLFEWPTTVQTNVSAIRLNINVAEVLPNGHDGPCGANQLGECHEKTPVGSISCKHKGPLVNCKANRDSERHRENMRRCQCLECHRMLGSPSSRPLRNGSPTANKRCHEVRQHVRVYVPQVLVKRAPTHPDGTTLYSSFH